MSLFRLDASIRTEGSVTRAVADTAQRSFLDTHSGLEVVRRDLTTDPLPAGAWVASVTAGMTPPAQWSDDQTAARALAADLGDELLAAEAYVFAVPMYNYGVSQHFKQWWDLLVTDPRFAAGSEPLLAGRPAVLVTARGGGYGEGTPRAGWDHATPWMTRALRDILQLDLAVDEVELTLADVTPAMESLRPAAAQLLAQGHDAARAHGQAIAERLVGSAA